MTKKSDILSAIRKKCLDCCVGSLSEVRLCHLNACNLHPFRFGKDPNPSKTVGFAKLHAQADDFEPDDSADLVYCHKLVEVSE